MSKKIKFTVGDTVQAEAVGYNGPSCEVDVHAFLNSVGLVESVSSERLPEFYQQTVETEREAN